MTDQDYQDSKHLLRDAALGVAGAIVFGLLVWGVAATLGLPVAISMVGASLASMGIVTVVNVYYARKRDDRWREEVRLHLGQD